MEQRHEYQNEDRWGSLLILLFIALLVLKAMSFDISWWIVTAPISLPTVYMILAGILLPERMP